MYTNIYKAYTKYTPNPRRRAGPVRRRPAHIGTQPRVHLPAAFVNTDKGPVVENQVINPGHSPPRAAIETSLHEDFPLNLAGKI